MDVIKSSDYVIDIGPEGGERGGEIVAKGTPEEVANNPKSYTGQYLEKVLKKTYRASGK
jgi:excinuclease ABC subunit A